MNSEVINQDQAADGGVSEAALPTMQMGREPAEGLAQPQTTPSSKTTSWSQHPINLRMSVPFFGSRYYLTLVAGRERRSIERLHAERDSHPVVTLGNAFFALGITTLIAIAGLAVLIVQSAMIE